MRIAINCRSILKPQRTGIGRYTYCLIQSLARIDDVNAYELYTPCRLFDFKRRAPAVPGRNFKVRRDYFNAGAARVLGDVDVYHLTSPDWIDAHARTKVVVTVHDLIHRAYPQGHTPETIRQTEEKFKAILGRADLMICSSRATKDDLIRFYQVAPSRCEVVYQGVDHKTFYPRATQEGSSSRAVLVALNIEGPYCLFVGTLEPRKNLIGLLKAFAKVVKGGYRGRLVIAGMKGWMMNGFEDQLAQDGLREQVVLTGFVTDEQLRVLYGSADAFVYPSFYEGFGFPILEAFACGALVITSRTSSCGEIAADAALTIDPSDSDQLADQLMKAVQCPDQFNDVRQKAIARARQFSFDETARQTLELYRRVAQQVS